MLLFQRCWDSSSIWASSRCQTMKATGRRHGSPTVLSFHKVMARDHFQEISWMLHVGAPGVIEKKIDKVKPLLDILLPHFQQLWVPSQNLAVYETVVGFRGRLNYIQYMPQKPTKWGIKAFTLADGANGYFLNTIPYTGAQTLENADPTYQY